jgi:hypothetical protein
LAENRFNGFSWFRYETVKTVSQQCECLSTGLKSGVNKKDFLCKATSRNDCLDTVSSTRGSDDLECVPPEVFGMNERIYKSHLRKKSSPADAVNKKVDL